MSHAAGNLRLQHAAIPSPKLTPGITTNATALSASAHHDSTAVDNACAEIFKRWRRFLSEQEARAQAEQFRQRCETLICQVILTETELDAMLDRVANAMAAS